MASITEPPVIPNLSLPVPSRLNPEPFSMLMDRTLLEIPVTVDGINVTVSWVYDVSQLMHGWAQSTAKDAVQCERYAQMSVASATASEQARADITQLLDTITGELGLPETGTVGAPIIKTAEGLAIDQYPLGDQARANDEPLVEVSAEYLAKPFQVIGLDTRTGGFEVTLPADPRAGMWVSFYDVGSSRDVWHGVTLQSSQRIMGLDEDLQINRSGARFKVEYLGETRGWVITL